MDCKHCKIQSGTLGEGGLLGASRLSPASPGPEQEIFTAALGMSPPTCPRAGQEASAVPGGDEVAETDLFCFFHHNFGGGGRDKEETSSRQVCLIARSGQLK